LAITLRISLYPSNTFGERIRKWRMEQGLFQRDFAKMLGVDEMTIVNWEKGLTRPAWDKVIKIKNILKI
jgi:DNA-binding XRE family transcriptional regulator